MRRSLHSVRWAPASGDRPPLLHGDTATAGRRISPNGSYWAVDDINRLTLDRSKSSCSRWPNIPSLGPGYRGRSRDLAGDGRTARLLNKLANVQRQGRSGGHSPAFVFRLAADHVA
jgi:hypothetical protein